MSNFLSIKVWSILKVKVRIIKLFLEFGTIERKGNIYTNIPDSMSSFFVWGFNATHSKKNAIWIALLYDSFVIFFELYGGKYWYNFINSWRRTAMVPPEYHKYKPIFSLGFLLYECKFFIASSLVSSFFRARIYFDIILSSSSKSCSSFLEMNSFGELEDIEIIL